MHVAKAARSEAAATTVWCREATRQLTVRRARSPVSAAAVHRLVRLQGVFLISTLIRGNPVFCPLPYISQAGSTLPFKWGTNKRQQSAVYQLLTATSNAQWHSSLIGSPTAGITKATWCQRHTHTFGWHKPGLLDRPGCGQTTLHLP